MNSDKNDKRSVATEVQPGLRSWQHNYIWTGEKIKTRHQKSKILSLPLPSLILECTEHKNSGKSGTSRYITTKNKKNNPERLELKKYNPILKKYTVHKEIK